MKKRLLCGFLAMVMLVFAMPSVTMAAESDVTADAAATEAISVDFGEFYANGGTKAQLQYSVSTETPKRGFVQTSGAIMPPGDERTLAPNTPRRLTANGMSITESSGGYLSNDANLPNYGGLIYRVDVPAGAYHIEVELGGDSVGGTNGNTYVQPTGMEYDRIRRNSNWDEAGAVERYNSVIWANNNKTWMYDFATGQDFIEIEIEPSTFPTRDNPQTVTVKSITIEPLETNVRDAGDDVVNIYVLGGSTEKTYPNNQAYSSWAQVLDYYLDSDKAKVINYSMGGRSMKRSYTEGRMNDILLTAREGDYVFLTSAQGDEADGHTRYDRGLNYSSPANNNALYQRWLDMYIKAFKERGINIVLVPGVPRGNGFSLEGADKPNGFNPDSVGLIRKAAANDSEIAYIELYEGIKDYVKELGADGAKYIFSSFEAGENPAQNAANGVVNGDGTTYKESASKQFVRIMLEAIYTQSRDSDDPYSSRRVMRTLYNYIAPEIRAAIEQGDWTEIFPEMAADVSQIGITSDVVRQPKDNYYYRDSIESILRLGALHKDADNNFKPTQTITVGEFARAMEIVFGLDENSLESYVMTYDELKTKYGDQLGVASAAEGEDVPVVGDNQYLITINQSEGGTITAYNETKFDYQNVDITGELDSNGNLADNYFMTVTPPESLVSGTDSSATIDNTDIYNGYIEFRNDNPSMPVTYTSKANGKLVVYARYNDNKYIDLTSQDGSTQSRMLNGGGTTGNNVYGSVEFNVENNTTYTLTARGGTGRLFGLRYYSLNYPQSTDYLVVDKNDMVKITAIADPGYLNGEIFIDGASVTAEREYTIDKVTSNVSVSATYVQEPAFAESGEIASDAALTREAMGTILYDAYMLKYGKDESGNWVKVDYMKQNDYLISGNTLPAPGDAAYDQNSVITFDPLTTASNTIVPYFPLVGWGALRDTDDITPVLYGKVKEAYNLGLMRSEIGIERGVIVNGTILDPKTEVSRGKAAKTLLFAYILAQPTNAENQILENKADDTIAPIETPNSDAPSVPVRLLPTPTPEPTPEPTAEPTPTPEINSVSWDFNSIPAGTTYNHNGRIANEQGMVLRISYGSSSNADSKNPAIVERAEGDNYLEFTDGGAGTDGWECNITSGNNGSLMEAKLIVIEQDFKLVSDAKDVVLFRFCDSVHANTNNTYTTSSDNRAFDLKTGENGTLKITDYFSNGKDESALDYDVHGFNFTPGSWCTVRIEYVQDTNTVNVLAKLEGEDELKYIGSVELGLVNPKVEEMPKLGLSSVKCVTRGSDATNLCVDNVLVGVSVDDPVDATPTPVPTAAPYVAGSTWDFNTIPAGTTYKNNDRIPNEENRVLRISYNSGSSADSQNPAIVEKTPGDNYLKFTDGGAGTDGWECNITSGSIGRPLDSEVIILEQDFKLASDTKDVVLFRFFDEVHAGADVTYSTDDRAFDLTTGDNGTLRVVDYFSGSGKESSSGNTGYVYNLSGFNYAPNEWYTVRVEYAQETDTVTVLEKRDGEDYVNIGTVKLGLVNPLVEEMPKLTMSNLRCITRGSGATNLSVDNVFVGVANDEPIGTATPKPGPVSEYDYEIVSAGYDANGILNPELKYNGSDANPSAVLLVGVYSNDQILTSAKIYNISGTSVQNMDFTKPAGGTVKLFIWNSTDGIKPLSEAYTVNN